ncbi:MAG: flagellar hook-length control protein FliK [Calditrichaeota bacterium]|nr:flagellar hook-length control protein FliK [Calditrichota bacterium]
MPAWTFPRGASIALPNDVPVAEGMRPFIFEKSLKDKTALKSAEVLSPRNPAEKKTAQVLSNRTGEPMPNRENRNTQPSHDRPENKNPWTADASPPSANPSSEQGRVTETAASRAPLLSLRVEQLQELRALLNQVLKTSQVLRLNEGHGVHFLWASKEWGPIRFAVRQHAHEIAARVEVQRPEIQAVLEAHRETLSQIFSEQGLYLDRLEIESSSATDTFVLREVKWDEPRQNREHPRAFLDRDGLVLEEDILPESTPEAREVTGRVWIA